MRKIKTIVVSVIGVLVFLTIIELTIPAANGITYGILHMLIPSIKEFYLKDWIWMILLFFLGAFCLYGTVHISRKAENRLWAIVTAIITITSFVLMLVAAPGAE